MCGKDGRIPGEMNGTEGSPPRVREGQQLISLMIVKKRITPACAGRTYLSSVYFYIDGDHPRVCGKDYH